MLGRLSDALRDVRHAVRGLAKAPSFALTVVGTLGLAIGASAAIFTVVDTVLLEPLPYPDADRLVVIEGSAPGTDLDEEDLSAEFYLEFKAQADLLENVGTFNVFTSTLRTPERVERVWMSNPTLSLFETLGVKPQLGRLPTPEDGELAAVLSHTLWMEWFGGDPNVLGRSFSMAGATRTVVGVMGPDFDFPSENVQLWFPSTLGVVEQEITPGQFGLPIVARVRPGVDPEALIAQLDLIASRLPEKYGGSSVYADIMQRFVPRVVQLKEDLLGPLARPLWILLGAMAILLLIACANVTNLFVARTERQRRDVAVRHAIGAGRGRLILRQLAETLVVAIAAGALAVGVAAVLVPLIVEQAPFAVPRLSSTQLSLTTVLFTFGVSIVAGLVCGVLPALRTAGVNLTWLREGSRGATYGRRWTRDGLVMAQAALALLLLVGSGLLLRSFAELRNVDPGYVTEDIFTFQFAPEQAQLRDGPAWASFHLAFMERLRGLPGVEAVGIVENFPLNEGVFSTPFTTEQGAADAAPEYSLAVTFAAGDYFDAMGIRMLRGRNFTENEHTQNPGNVIIAQSAAERLWPGQDPLGKRLTISMFGLTDTVIGVVEDVRQNDFREQAGPDVYFPMVLQNPRIYALSTPGYVLRTSRAESIAPDVRALVNEVAPEAPMYRVFTIEELVGDSMSRLSFTLIALGLAAGLALFLGMVGLYGILSSMVTERTRELGIRIALGADPAGVRRMVVVQGMRVVGLGVLIGLIGALVGARSLESLLYGIRAFDFATLAGTSLLMLLIGAVASWIPAYRASSVDPVKTLAES